MIKELRDELLQVLSEPSDDYDDEQREELNELLRQIDLMERRIEAYRADLVREIGYSHWSDAERGALKLALKWHMEME